MSISGLLLLLGLNIYITDETIHILCMRVDICMF